METRPLPLRHGWFPARFMRSQSNLVKGKSEAGKTRASQESLMSLMSSGGNSGMGTGYSAFSPMNIRRNLRSISSAGSSKGSHSDIHNSRNPQNGRMMHNGGEVSVRSGPRSNASQRSSGFSGSSSFAAVAPGLVPMNLKIRPLFNLETSSDLDTPFLGREWLYRDIYETLLRPSSNDKHYGGQAMLIHSNPGAGKTSFMRQIALKSPFHTALHDYQKVDGNRGSLDSGFAGGSRLSLNHNVPQSSERLCVVASRVAAYQFCRLESSASCSTPEFVCHLAAQLAICPYLRAYAEFLTANCEIQEKLTLPQALRIDPVDLFRISICEPLKSIKPPDTGPLLILVDGLDEAEYHKPESGDSIGSFLAKNAQHLPSWLRLILTIRNENVDVMESMGCRHVSLDDAVLDERIWRDVREYVDYRIQCSPALRLQLEVTTGLPDNTDPLAHFAHHLASIAKGNLLYARLTIDLVEQGQLRLKSASYSVLPVSLPEVFLLIFNLKFPSIRSFEKVLPILSVLLASLHPLSARDLYEILNSGKIGDLFSWEEFCDRLAKLDELLIHRADDSYAPFHPAFRDWLIRRQDGHSPKFLADMRQGHTLIALNLSRKGNLNPDEMIELGHHLLKAHPYKYLKYSEEGVNKEDAKVARASGRDCQLLWIQQSGHNLLKSLCSERNMACPNTKVSRLLLLAGASTDATLSDGQPILCRAAEAGQTDLCALLLEFGANVECTEPVLGRTPIMLAAGAGHLDVVQILHQHKAKLAQQDNRGYSALVHAAEAGHVTTVSFLMQCDWLTISAPMTSSSENQYTDDRQKCAQQAFVRAAAKGQTKVCEFLLEMSEVSLEGADPVTGETALCAACSAAHADTAQYLLSCGAVLDGPSSVKKPQLSQLHNHVNQERTTAADLELFDQSQHPLICAVRGGSWEIVSGLLARGLDPEERGPNGMTPLMAAAKHGHIGVMELLLSRGARVDSVDHQSMSPLSWACKGGHAACAALLADRGSRLDTVDSHGRSLLHLAAESAGKRTIQLLLERGCSLEDTDPEGLRPLDVAVKSRNCNALQCFLRKGAKLGAGTWQLANGCTEIAIILVQKLLEDGNLLYRRGRVKDAAQRYHYALRKCPQYLLIQSPNEQPDPTGSLKNFKPNLSSDQAAKAKQLNYHLVLGLARCRRRQGEFSAAVKLCTDALALVGANEGFEACFLRAKCHFDAQDSAAARRDAEEAVRLSPASREARHLLQSLTLPTDTKDDSNHDPVVTLQTSSSPPPPIITAGIGGNQASQSQKSCSPADCSSDSGNQADFEDPNLISPGRNSLETEL